MLFAADSQSTKRPCNRRPALLDCGHPGRRQHCCALAVQQYRSQRQLGTRPSTTTLPSAGPWRLDAGSRPYACVRRAWSCDCTRAIELAVLGWRLDILVGLAPEEDWVGSQRAA